ncbi:MAG: hypothetical protein ACRCVN_01535 [Spirochaetia bacterium]
MRCSSFFQINRLFSALIFFTALTAYGQSLVEADKIFANKRQYDLVVAPLDDYFFQNSALAPNSPPPQGLKERLYRAFWQIDARGLWLTQLQGQRDNQPLSLSRKLPIFADWHSGIIVAPTGKELFFDLSGEPTAFTHYQIWRIKKGTVSGEKILNYSQYQEFKQRQFDVFKQTAAYQDVIDSLKEIGLTESLDNYIFEENLGFLGTDIEIDA